MQRLAIVDVRRFGFGANTMKNILILLVCVLLLPVSALAAVLSDRDVAQLHSEIDSMYVAFERGDAKELINRTHESIYNLVGSKEAFEDLTLQAMELLQNSGIKFLQSELGAPTQTYSAGKEEICFVPRISVMEIQGKQAKSTGFMIAIRRLGTHKWMYLDGAGLQKNPDTLYQLFPTLERGVELPPSKVESL